jgi:hypothetical protein
LQVDHDRLYFAVAQSQLAPHRAWTRARRNFPWRSNTRSYDIDPFEGDPGQWRARITRLDGKKIKVAVPPSEHVFLDTSPRVSEEEAAKLAKQGIVGGGMD